MPDQILPVTVKFSEHLGTLGESGDTSEDLCILQNNRVAWVMSSNYSTLIASPSLGGSKIQ